ncbi:MAG: alpha/beta hydrolase [Pseudomonadota bacterium]
MNRLSDVPLRPGPGKRWLELRAPLEFASLGAFSPMLLTAPRGDGRRVMLLPGFLASGASMLPLCAYLRFLGYDAHEWGLGRNRGSVVRYVQQLSERLQGRAQRQEAPITLIGWSLGGVVARELARLNEDCVREIITMGTPILGGPKYTAVGEYYARTRGIDVDAFERAVEARNRAGIRQPITSIYSKSDAIVAWQASIDRYNPQARNVQVESSHVGLGVNPIVWMEIAATLARNPQDDS